MTTKAENKAKRDTINEGGMTTEEVVAYFGSKRAVANAIGIKEQALTGWGRNPPALRQFQLQTVTKGKLKVDKSCMKG